MSSRFTAPYRRLFLPVVVALASKLARIVWAVLRTGQAFEMGVAAAAG